MKTIESSGKSPLILRWFGASEVLVQSEPLPPLRYRKDLWLLAYLTLRHDRAVTRTAVAALFWPDAEESLALYYLRRSLSNLRRALGPEADRLLTPSPQILQIDLSDADCDVVAFDAALTRLAVSANPEESLQLAVSLYRGPLLPDCLDDWAIAERNAREQSYLDALERLARITRTKGEPSAAVRWLRLLLTADPNRESAARELMQALADSGDPAALQRVYQKLRTHLWDALNTKPAPETEALYKRLTEQLAQPAPLPLLPSSTSTSSLRHLPVPLTDLIGRESEIAEIGVGLGRSRLLTLLGPGGVGKTRLAIAAADVILPRFADGVWFVDLAPLTDESLVGEVIARTLGVPPEAGKSAEERLVSALRTRSILLVLDNCEHLLDTCAVLAQRLLLSCPGLRILATSRQALGVTGEQVYPVPSLALPPFLLEEEDSGDLNVEKNPAFLREYAGVELFVQRAVQANTAFRLDRHNARAVCLICHRLDGIPLAIELAAARVRSLSTNEIQVRLADRFKLLTTGSRAALPRQQTLRALVDWSYSLLTPTEQAVLCRLSVFAGGWTLEAAEKVCTTLEAGNGVGIEDWELLDALALLVEKSLVIYEQGRGQESEPRYRLLETIRQYASDRLREAGEDNVYRHRHSDYFLTLAEEIQPKLKGAEQGRLLDRLETEHDNLRQALTFCEGNLEGNRKGLRLVSALSSYWLTRNHVSEARQRSTTFLAMEVNAAPTEERATAILMAGSLAYCQGDNIAARKHYEEARDIRQHLGDRHGMAGPLGNLGNVAQIQGDLGRARAYFEEALAIAREFDNLHWQSTALTCLGSVTFAQEDFAASRVYAEAALDICRQTGKRDVESAALRLLGIITRRQSSPREALRFYEQALVIHRELGQSSQEWTTLYNMASAYDILGDIGSAGELFCQALSLIKEGGDLRAIAPTLEGIAHFLAAHSPDFLKSACRLLGAAESLREESGTPYTADEQDIYNKVAAKARHSLPPKTISTAAEEGRAMTVSPAIAYAIRETQALREAILRETRKGPGPAIQA